MSAKQKLVHATIGLAVASALTLPALGETSALAQTPVRAGESAPTRPLFIAHRDSADVSIMTATRDGQLTLLASGVPTGVGTRPIVVSPDGRFAFAVGREANEIWSYAIGRGGALTPLPVIGSQHEFPFGILMAPDGRTLYVGNQSNDTVSAYAIGTDGSLTPRGPAVPSGAVHTRVMSVTPDGRFMFISHGDPASGHPAILTGLAVQPDGTLTPHVGPISVGTIAAGAPTITPDGRFLYVPGQLSNELYGFRIGTDGNVTPLPGSPYPAPGEPLGTVATPDGRHLYVGGSTGDFILAYRIGVDGALEPVPGSPYPSGDLPIGMTPSPDGRFLYVANYESHNVYVFAIAATGALSKTPGSPVLTGGANPATRAVAFLPNQEPRARFASSPRPSGQPTRFDARASSDRDGRVARYDWDFGDGTVGPDAGPTPTHVYRQPGAYPVTLTVTDDEGCSTRLVYTGYIALCTGSPAATTTRRIIVP